ncbi:hypothetical protein BDQ12DRAFT_658830 [Crucibulum laeve]|uniref:BTB domain-containing protein n=1 Tax=Crucibulum laeve TaxID=68775 RepID=A0A5C3LVG9_9AGAR|nr:hypothetical protein BDQ12DRAFT_658830 [Crucibulum laeve]
MAQTLVKRRRDSSDSDDGLRFVRSRIWSENNRVVIEAGQMHLCVFRDLLCIHSAVLKARVEALPPSDFVQGVDGCPVLCLNDSPRDVEHLLDALIDSRCVTYFNPKDRQPLEKVSALLRLGKNYEIELLKNGAVSCLRSHCKEWLEINAKDDAKSWAGVEDFDSPRTVVEIIKLARQTNVISVLPDMFTQCAATLSTEQIIRGVAQDDGLLSILSPQDQQVCITGRDKLRIAQTKELYAWLDEGKVRSPSCHTARSGDCSWNKARQAAKMYTEFQTYPLLHAGQLPPRPTDLIPSLCSVCRMVTLQSYLQGYGRIREALPSYFNLPSWTDLKA